MTLYIGVGNPYAGSWVEVILSPITMSLEFGATKVDWLWEGFNLDWTYVWRTG